tara:strand:+ start:75 stop:620 length:546 start_codon:yes stop_codon:yes gene_type:complete
MSTRRILGASVIAAVLAAIVLLVAVLPAEFGIDPLGTGRALGLLDLADVSDSPYEKIEQVHKVDRTEFILEPFQSVEYKYQLSEDSTMIFSWVATGELEFDMHADPDGMEGEEGVESFDKGSALSGAGIYHAPFTGIHGWFWENRSFEQVHVQLDSAGFYDSSIVFRDGGSFDRELNAAIR